MVEQLNRPPFMLHLSLYEFDDKPPLELLEMLNKVLVVLDEGNKVNIQTETQDKTSERICGFLKVLGYPSDYSVQFQRDLVHGEKKTIQHVMHWMLSRISDLQKKAETAKFLVPYIVPDEFQHEDTMQDTIQLYRDLQAEYAAVHQNIMQLRQESMQPSELKKEIQQLESEKDQLQTKINLFKAKSNNDEFQQLLEATSKLRKEQE